MWDEITFDAFEAIWQELGEWDDMVLISFTTLGQLQDTDDVHTGHGRGNGGV
jgi:hypothetical protein